MITYIISSEKKRNYKPSLNEQEIEGLNKRVNKGE
jgi:hypothetical protein